MFRNSGGKLKVWAVITFILGIAGSLSYAIFIWATTGFLGGYFVFLGFVMLIAGPLTAYLSALIIYGIGEAADNRPDYQKIAELVCRRMKQESGGGTAAGVVRAAKDSAEPAVDPVNGEQKKEGGEPRPVIPSDLNEVPVTIQNDRIVCPVCGTDQRANRNTCYHCLVKFIKEDGQMPNG